LEIRGKVAGLTRVIAAPGLAPQSGPTETGKLYNGYGDGMARAFELALVPAIFCGFGYVLDRWLGIMPVLSIVLFLVAVAGLFAKTWYEYEARMQLEDATAPWAKDDTGPWAKTDGTGAAARQDAPA